MAHQHYRLGRASAERFTEDGRFSYCALPQMPERAFSPEVGLDRQGLILMAAKKWVNGTILHYYFFDEETDGENVFLSDGTRRWVSWRTDDAEKDIVRQAFERWKGLGIGLEFEEVSSRDDAEIRIGFMRGNGAWSYVGRDVLNIGRDSRTMNFGWDLKRHPSEMDTALHEIGHTLGFPHEHQNPHAGIVWNEEAVYAALGGPPNFWSRDKTFHNIIRKISPDQVQGSNWDADSVMHYPFEAGMIDRPEEYREGINPAGGLSERDRTWVQTFYPPLGPSDYTRLAPLQLERLSIQPGQQRNFVIEPEATRKYDIRTFGISDTVIVLFEDQNGDLRYRAGDDDSGENYNASMNVKLFKGRRYVLRVRLYYADRVGETAIMFW